METMRTPGFFKSPKSLFWIAAAVLLIVAAFFAFRTSLLPKKEGNTLFSYLSAQSVEAVTLNMDLQVVYGKDSADFPAVLSWAGEDGVETSIPVELCLRGNNRRELCSFPPLKLTSFENKELGLRKEHFKLVTHCNEDSGETLLLREYLAYRLYSELTEASFQARLVRVTYEDHEGDSKTVHSWAILLEPKEHLLERLDACDAVVDGAVSEISGPEYNLFVVFQFMIGNTDWNLDKEHNVKLLSYKKGGLPFPVPYDFDRSGLVNAPYATPSHMLPIGSVRERHFQWRGHDRSQLKPVFDLLRQRRDDLLGICWDFDALPIEERQNIVLYLEEFFNGMDQLLGEGRRMANSVANEEGGVS